MNTPPSGSPISNLMFITGAGKVGIGTTSPVDQFEVNVANGNGGAMVTSQPDAVYSSRSLSTGKQFQLIGSYMGWDQNAIYIGGYNVWNNGSYSGNKIVCGGQSGGELDIYAWSFQTTSTRKAKKNIHNLTYGLEEIKKLRPVFYTGIHRTDNRVDLGFIAEEVNEIIPESVAKDDKGNPAAINLGSLVPVLTSAIQEQQKQIQELLKRIEVLEKR